MKDAALKKVASGLKRMELQVVGRGPFKEEFVTAGGVDLKQVDLKTMQSKLVKNLYFGGEVSLASPTLPSGIEPTTSSFVSVDR